jgi:hypothetical protein
MGANSFQNWAEGASAKEAFKAVTDQARYEHGHGGYTGTIAEKHSFVMVPPPKGDETLQQVIDDWVDGCNKWGDAGCIQTGPDQFVFFGMASS